MYRDVLIMENKVIGSIQKMMKIQYKKVQKNSSDKI